MGKYNLDHINREGYSRLYTILENTGLWNWTINSSELPLSYSNAGLRSITCRPNYSLKPNFEFMSAEIVDKDLLIYHEIYFSIYEPVYIINMSDVEVTQYEKDLLYSYTSKYWNELMDIYKKLYSDEYQQKCIHQFTNKDCTKIIYPYESPDYRLLPLISPKEI